MSEHTAESLMSMLTKKVADNEPLSPAYWCEMALRVNALAVNLDNQLAHLENLMNHLEAEYIKQDMPSSKAKVLARANIDYESYLRLRAVLNRIKEFMSLARKRSMINEL